MQGGELHTAASYLIILQSLEPASVAKQHATQLLDAALDQVSYCDVVDLRYADPVILTKKSQFDHFGRCLFKLFWFKIFMLKYCLTGR